MAIRIPIAVSARHVHLSQATLDRLFGAGHPLRPRTWLSQHGQFAAEETVTLIGPAGRLQNVRVMGPPRARDQVEISRSDGFVLGIDAPVRISGDLAGTPGVIIEGPAGRAPIADGVISSRRHLHMNPRDAELLGLRDGESVQIKIDSDGRDLIFGDCIIRIAADFHLELHLDTDEANAAGISRGAFGELTTPSVS